jgi:methyl coenzyme M reductase subunit C-like uncharacterized protein (methanogenesis marker protein 7)
VGGQKNDDIMLRNPDWGAYASGGSVGRRTDRFPHSKERRENKKIKEAITHITHRTEFAERGDAINSKKTQRSDLKTN